MKCFIRRQDRKGWVPSRLHHHQALISFMNTPYNMNDRSSIEITVPHVDGGDFTAYFNHYSYYKNNENNENNENQKHTNNTFCYYDDKYGNRVEIMICKPEHAAYINRLIDY
jgi:hypothetical protein